MDSIGNESTPVFVNGNGVAKPIGKGLLIINVTVWKNFVFYANFNGVNSITGKVDPEGGKKSEFSPTNRPNETEDAIVVNGGAYQRNVYINNIPDGYVPVGIVGINVSAGAAFAWREWHVDKVTVDLQEKYIVRLHGRYLAAPNPEKPVTVVARVLLVKTPWLGDSISSGDPDIAQGGDAESDPTPPQ